MITFITPTGDRPIALKLCAEFVTSQITDEKIQWIIADDSIKKNSESYSQQLDIIKTCQEGNVDLLHITRQPKPEEMKPGNGAMSLAQNLIEAIPHVEGDRVLIFEDDDWYSPHRTAIHLKWLETCDIVGPIWQPYYNIEQMSAKVFKSRGSSLCSTSFRPHLLPLLKDTCESCYRRNLKGIDAGFWSLAQRSGKYRSFISESDIYYCVGIKRLPGRTGIGVGHKGHNFEPDLNAKRLRQWVGETWANRYLEIRNAVFGNKS
ncbi:MAG: hypothetical protein ABIK92_21920 [Pseudomonadota bacterium]